MEVKLSVSNAFSPESGFMSGFSKVVDTLILAVLWLICCIPIITVGAASSGLYYAYHKAIRQDGGHACRHFFKAFGANFMQATGIWLILLLFLASSAAACYLLAVLRQSMPAAGALMIMGMVIIGFAVAWCLYLFPYQARFENKVTNVLKNSAILALANAPRSLLLLLIFAAAVAIIAYKPAVCAPVIAVYIWLSNKILESVFRKLMTEETLQSELNMDRN